MSRYDEFIRQVESESQAEGPKAVAELKAFRDYYRVARQLAQRRRYLEWNQVDLAELTGIHQSEISRIEQARGNQSFSTLSRLTTALGISLSLQIECDDAQPPLGGPVLGH